MPTASLEDFKTVVANRLQLDPATLYGKKLRLSEVVAKSPVAKNSIDLMEAVAGALAELELDDRLELPAMTLDNTVDDLLGELKVQFDQLRGA